MILVDTSQTERVKSKSVSYMGLTDQSSQYYDSIDRWRCYAIHLVKQKATKIGMFDIIKKKISK